MIAIAKISESKRNSAGVINHDVLIETDELASEGRTLDRFAKKCNSIYKKQYPVKSNGKDTVMYSFKNLKDMQRFNSKVHQFNKCRT